MSTTYKDGLEENFLPSCVQVLRHNDCNCLYKNVATDAKMGQKCKQQYRGVVLAFFTKMRKAYFAGSSFNLPN